MKKSILKNAIKPNSSSSTLVFVITNQTDKRQAVSLFNQIDWYRKVLPEGVTITCPISSYDKVMLEAHSYPFQINGLKIIVDNKEKLFDPEFTIHVGYSNCRGRWESIVYSPRYVCSNMQNVITEVDDPTFEMHINSTAKIDLHVNPGEQIEFVFTISEVYDLVKIIHHVIEYLNRPSILNKTKAGIIKAFRFVGLKKK